MGFPILVKWCLYIEPPQSVFYTVQHIGIRTNLTVIMQTTFSNAFPQMKVFVLESNVTDVFFSKGPIDNKSVLAWCAGPSLEPKMTHSTDAYKRRPVSMCQVESTVRFTKRAQYCFNTSVPSLFLNKLDRYRKWTYRKNYFATICLRQI